MSDKLRAAAQMALEALENPDGLDSFNRSIADTALAALREALAEQPRLTPPAGADDPLYPRAVSMVREHGKASIRLLKRELGVGGIRAELMPGAMVGTVIDKAAPEGRLLPAADTEGASNAE